MEKTLAPQNTVTTRDPKGLKFISIVESAYNKAGLSEDEAQHINDTAGLANVIGNFIADNRLPDKFKDEEVESSYGYLSGYKPKGITEQTNILRQLFPGVGFADEKLAERPVPANAEGWFAIPKWQTIAPTYGEAVEKVLAKISETRKGKFKNWREGNLGRDYLKQTAKTEKVFQTLGDEQKDHDILVVAAQFGLRHRGRSVRRAREVMQVNEFGLGAFAVGIMLLTHPERLMNYDDLYVDCAGDEYAPEADGGFSYAPFFCFHDGEVGFGASWFVNAFDNYGSSSAFLPQ
ncbi:MAG: hypothetical protein NTY93_00265 [Candidatus Kaiserbacteria bacterium]|nr:hypothetical protein [Candidatus Kaiserbacteria bacterium]